MNMIPTDQQQQRSIQSKQGGFSLLEMIISTSVFIVVMLVIIGALISLTDASRKARATRIVLDNLSSAIDSMSRNMRMGTYFHCGCEVNPANYATPQSCSTMDSQGNGGATCVAFEPATGNPSSSNDQVVYQWTSGRIERSTDGGQTFVSLTAPEINVTDLRFFVYGTTVKVDQPVVTMLLRGTATLSPKISTSFNMQTTIAARTPNFLAY